MVDWKGPLKLPVRLVPGREAILTSKPAFGKGATKGANFAFAAGSLSQIEAQNSLLTGDLRQERETGLNPRNVQLGKLALYH